MENEKNIENMTCITELTTPRQKNKEQKNKFKGFKGHFFTFKGHFQRTHL